MLPVPRSRAIQPVGRPDALADLVTQHLDGETRFVAVDVRSVDEQARRFVDGDDVRIGVKDVERFLSQRNVAGRCRERACR